MGEWIAVDQWQSEFSIKINKDGTATSNYADGESGNWKIVDGNLKILWDSGKSDYFFKVLWAIRELEKIKITVTHQDLKDYLTNFKDGFRK